MKGCFKMIFYSNKWEGLKKERKKERKIQKIIKKQSTTIISNNIQKKSKDMKISKEIFII